MEPLSPAECWETNATTWTRHVRAGYDIYRDALNTPAFVSFLPPVRDLRGLDIGCGEGHNTRVVAQLGASMTGIDVAPTFICHAREAEDSRPCGIAYQTADAAALPFADASFDFATAFMSLMDMPDQPTALREAFRVLHPGGFLQFSILHPCFAPPGRKVLRSPDGSTRAIEVAGYYNVLTGEEDVWWFSSAPPEERERVPPFRTPRFHRTLSGWVEILCQAGFAIEALAEPRATPEQAAVAPAIEDTLVAPLFLHMRCRKPATA